MADDKTPEQIKADQDTRDAAAATDKARLEREASAKPKPFAASRTEPEPAPDTAAARLRAFEDAHFGKKAVRIRGHIEKGYGSPFKEMIPEKHAEYAALEKLVEAEAEVDRARAALTAADVAHEAAKEAVVTATKVSEAAAAESQKVDAEIAADQRESA